MSFGKAVGYSMLGLGVAGTTAGGAFGGAYLSAQSGGNAQSGAIAGGLTGLGASIGTIAGVKGVMGIPKAFTSEKNVERMKAFGKKTIDHLKSDEFKEGVKAFGTKAKDFGISTGKGALKGVGAVGNLGVHTALKAGAKYSNLATSLFKADKTGKSLFKASGLGVAAMGIGGIVSAGVSAVDTFNTLRRGQSDGQVTTATPSAPTQSNYGSSSMRNAGATGDLAFAMRNLRYGG